MTSIKQSLTRYIDLTCGSIITPDDLIAVGEKLKVKSVQKLELILNSDDEWEYVFYFPNSKDNQ